MSQTSDSREPVHPSRQDGPDQPETSSDAKKPQASAAPAYDDDPDWKPPVSIGPKRSGTPRSERSVCLGLTALAAIMFGVYLWQARTEESVQVFHLPQGEALAYHDFAWQLAQTGEFEKGPFWKPPLYPYFLALVYKVSGNSILAARIIQAVIGVATILLAWSLARRLLGSGVALLAAVILCYYGPVQFFTTELVPAGVIMFTWVLALYLLIRALDRPLWHAWLVTGLAGGLAALASPGILPFMLVVILWRAWTGITKRAPGGMAQAGLCLAGLALAIAPVTIRNYAVSRSFFLIHQTVGLDRFIANNPDALATMALQPGPAMRALRSQGVLHGARTPAEHDAYFRDRVWSFLAEEPGAFLKNLLVKTRMLLSGREIPWQIDMNLVRGNSSVLAMLTGRLWLVWLPFGLIAPFAVLGLYTAWKANGRSRWLIVYLLACGAAIVFTIPTARYRMPLVPVMVILAASGIVWLRDRVRDGKWSHLMTGLVPVILAGVVINATLALPVDKVDFRAEAMVNFARQALRTAQAAAATGSPEAARQSLENARKAYEKAIEVHPDSAAYKTELAELLLGLQNHVAARELLERAIELDPGLGEAHLLLGRIAERDERFSDALSHYREATELAPHLHDGRLGLVRIALRQHQPDEAIALLREGIERIPGAVVFRFELANQLVAGQEYDQAIAELETAIEIDPEHAPSHHLLGRLMLNPKQQAALAIEHLTRAVDLAPANLISRMDLVTALGMAGRNEDAQKLFQATAEMAQATGQTQLLNQLLQARGVITTAPATATEPTTLPVPGPATRAE